MSRDTMLISILVHVLFRQEWLKLRKEYLELQKKSMTNLKKSLNALKHPQSESFSIFSQEVVISLLSKLKTFKYYNGRVSYFREERRG